MPTVTYRLADGGEQTVDVPDGTSVMQAAIANDVPGIVGECGGSAMCATCHVYVEGDAALPPVSDMESEMLDCTADERRQESRLGCQLVLGPELPELVVRVPSAQV